MGPVPTRRSPDLPDICPDHSGLHTRCRRIEHGHLARQVLEQRVGEVLVDEQVIDEGLIDGLDDDLGFSAADGQDDDAGGLVGGAGPLGAAGDVLALDVPRSDDDYFPPVARALRTNSRNAARRDL